MKLATWTTACSAACACRGRRSRAAAAAAARTMRRGSCGVEAQKQWVLDTTRTGTSSTTCCPRASTSRSSRRPRISSITSPRPRAPRAWTASSAFSRRARADGALFGEGEFIGFGFRTRTDPGPQVFLSEVIENSPASEAGLARGDEIVAVDTGSGFVTMSPTCSPRATRSTTSSGRQRSALRRGLRLADGSATREVSLVKRTVTIDPVPDDDGVRVLPLAGTAGVGYVNFRSYISTADGQLRSAFEEFPRAGHRLLHRGPALQRRRTREHLGAARRPAGRGAQLDGRDVAHALQLEPPELRTRRAHSDRSRSRSPRCASPSSRPRRRRPRARSTSTRSRPGSKSRSWAATPSASRSARVRSISAGCDDRMRLVAFKTVNALDEGDYFDGLAPTMTLRVRGDRHADRAAGRSGGRTHGSRARMAVRPAPAAA